MRNKKAQSIIEYTMLVVCLSAALLLMQHYVKRAAQGRLREAADTIGGQYDAGHINSVMSIFQSGTTTTISRQVEVSAPQLAEEGKIFGIRTTSVTGNERLRRVSSETLGEFPDELFE
ncbi:hypothetical protein ACFL1D_00035 [Candidatus Omnitrophota bacterium]